MKEDKFIISLMLRCIIVQCGIVFLKPLLGYGRIWEWTYIYIGASIRQKFNVWVHLSKCTEYRSDIPVNVIPMEKVSYFMEVCKSGSMKRSSIIYNTTFSENLNLLSIQARRSLQINLQK